MVFSIESQCVLYDFHLNRINLVSYLDYVRVYVLGV